MSTNTAPGDDRVVYVEPVLSFNLLLSYSLGYEDYPINYDCLIMMSKIKSCMTCLINQLNLAALCLLY